MGFQDELSNCTNYMLLSTQNVERKPNPNTLLVETDEVSAKGKDYNNWIGANHGSATQVARGWGGGSNSIGLNTGSTVQFSDYKDQASDYFNHSSDDKAADYIMGILRD